MKTLLIIILILLAGIGGYYLGNDHGYEKAIFDQNVEDVSENVDTSIYIKSAAETALVGLWRSKEDPRFTREFNSDGSAVDEYDNGDSIDSTLLTWNVFTKDEPDEEFTEAIEENTAYLRMVNRNDSLYFKINKITPDVLELIYLDRGGSLIFEKIN